MKNRKNLLLVVLLLLVVAVATASTYAWLTATATSGDLSYTVGDVSYSVSSSLSKTGTVVPGQPLGNFTITNSSNVVTNVRVKFTVTVSNVQNGASTDWSVGTDNTKDELLLSQTSTKWVLVQDGSNYYYYYGGVGSSTSTGNEDIAAGTATLDAIFDTLAINGKLVGNDYSGATVKITITFQAKQAEYVDWSELGSINWTAGI